MTTQDAAVTAAAEALALHVVALRRSDLTVVCDCGYDCDPCHFGAPWQKHLAAAAVAAARPIIEAEARERIAAEIEAEAASLRATEQPDYIRAALDLEVAARIARGTA